jgi:hypothetical protein
MTASTTAWLDAAAAGGVSTSSSRSCLRAHRRRRTAPIGGGPLPCPSGRTEGLMVSTHSTYSTLHGRAEGESVGDALQWRQSLTANRFSKGVPALPPIEAKAAWHVRVGAGTRPQCTVSRNHSGLRGSLTH